MSVEVINEQKDPQPVESAEDFEFIDEELPEIAAMSRQIEQYAKLTTEMAPVIGAAIDKVANAAKGAFMSTENTQAGGNQTAEVVSATPINPQVPAPIDMAALQASIDASVKASIDKAIKEAKDEADQIVASVKADADKKVADADKKVADAEAKLAEAEKAKAEAEAKASNPDTLRAAAIEYLKSDLSTDGKAAAAVYDGLGDEGKKVLLKKLHLTQAPTLADPAMLGVRQDYRMARTGVGGALVAAENVGAKGYVVYKAGRWVFGKIF